VRACLPHAGEILVTVPVTFIASHDDRGLAAFLAGHQDRSEIRFSKHMATCWSTSATPS
jgi:hypothetical protein